MCLSNHSNQEQGTRAPMRLFRLFFGDWGSRRNMVPNSVSYRRAKPFKDCQSGQPVYVSWAVYIRNTRNLTSSSQPRRLCDYGSSVDVRNSAGAGPSNVHQSPAVVLLLRAGLVFWFFGGHVGLMGPSLSSQRLNYFAVVIRGRDGFARTG